MDGLFSRYLKWPVAVALVAAAPLVATAKGPLEDLINSQPERAFVAAMEEGAPLRGAKKVALDR